MFDRSLAILVLLTTQSLFADDKELFDKYLDASREMLAKQHLVAHVTLRPPDKSEEVEYQLDHYADIQRLRLKDGTYVQKKGKLWLKSEDWGDTGSKVKSTKAAELSKYAEYPLVSFEPGEIRDLSQGARVYALRKTEQVEGGERLYFEVTREKPTNLGYPEYVFHKFNDDNSGLIEGFAGSVYDGEGRAHLNVTYGFLISVKAKVEVVKPPAAKKKPAPR